MFIKRLKLELIIIFSDIKELMEEDSIADPGFVPDSDTEHEVNNKI